MKTAAGACHHALIGGLAPTTGNDAKQRLESQRAAEQAALDLTNRKLSFLKETKADEFDPKLFAAWETVRVLKDAKTSHIEKAQQLAGLGG